MPTSFAEATAVSVLGSHEYGAVLNGDWTIGSVPHGGYVTSLFLRVAQTHFATTHPSRNQPHTIACHLHFLARTAIGPARFRVRDLKIGRGTSTVQITLCQQPNPTVQSDSAWSEKIVGIFTNSDMDVPVGPTFKTGWKQVPDPVIAKPNPDTVIQAFQMGPEELTRASDLPLIDHMPDLDDDGDGDSKYGHLRQATVRSRVLIPRCGSEVEGPDDTVGPSDDMETVQCHLDQWIAFRSRERIDNIALGFIADTFPQLIERLTIAGLVQAGRRAKESGSTPDGGEVTSTGLYWFPTVLLNLDIRKPLPADGVEALHCQVLTRKIHQGRFDIEMIIMDLEGDIVATSTHVCLILDMARNLSGRQRSSKL